MLSVYEAIKITYSDDGTVKKMSVTWWVGCWYTWFGRLSDIAHRYRKSVSIIETYPIDNIDFVAPSSFKTRKQRILFEKCPSRVVAANSKQKLVLLRCISEQLSGITSNKHCCEAFIQIKMILFSIAINRFSGCNPICCPAISGELRCFEIPCQVDNVEHRACARIPDVKIPCFVMPNFRSELSSTELWFVELAYRACVTDPRNSDVNSSAVI